MRALSIRRSFCIAAMAIPLIVFGDHLQSSVKEDLDSGGYRNSKSFKSNKFVYRSIGGNTTIKSEKKERKWYCGWLCKKPKSKKADRIVISNVYFSEVSPGLFANSGPIQKTCENASSCTLKEWAAGFNINMQFPNGENGGGLLPIDGVISSHTILIDGETFNVMTAKGKHPVPDGPIIQ